MKYKYSKKEIKEVANNVTSKLYKSIFKLSTPLLVVHYWSVYRELVSRDDFNSLDDLKMSYSIIRDELIERGVTNVWSSWNVFDSINWNYAFCYTFNFSYEFNLLFIVWEVLKWVFYCFVWVVILVLVYLL